MMRKLMQRLLVGFSATALVQMVFMFFMIQAGKMPVTLEFAKLFRNESAAMLAQLAMVCLIGVAFSCGAMIFEIEKWSYPVQGAVHFVMTAAVWMPIAWLCWRPNSAKTAILAALGWLFTYVVNWFVQYLIYRRSIRRLNEKISSFSEGGNANG